MNYKVLIIEDNDVVGKFLKSLLTKAGYEVLLLAVGGGAIEEMQRFKPHAILLDLMLPDMNGGDIIRKMQSDPEVAKIPLAVLSAVIDKNDNSGGKITIAEREFMALSKSITGSELLGALDELIKKK